jgi:uncharacterized protein YijF (DUF1287 family)
VASKNAVRTLVVVAVVSAFATESGSAMAAPGAVTKASTSPTKIVSAAQSQLGVREVGENRGKRVLEFQKAVLNDHYAVNAPWCASFVTWVGLQANDPTPFRSAIVSEWIVAADHGRHGMSFVRQSSVRVGDIVALKKKGSWQHIGIVSSVDKGISVISGNTTAADKKADGVFEKPLTTWTTKGYAATFIRNSA